MFMSRSNANSLSLRGYGPCVLKNLQANATFTFQDDNLTAIANDNSNISVNGKYIKDDRYDWFFKLGNETIATLRMKTNITGTQTWNVSFGGINKDLDLNFHPCLIDEFPCSNGHQCVSMDERCNLFATCQDASDEKNCSRFITKDGYNRLVPNVDTVKNDSVDITIDIEVIDLYVESLKANQFQAIYNMKIYWSDPGLTLMNLLKEDFDNKLSDTELKHIWLPQISYGNIQDKSSSSISTNDENVEMTRMSDALKDDPRDLVKNRKYSGRDNLMKQSNEYSVKFHCQFSTHGFPHKAQTCHMNLTIGGMKPELSTINENSTVTADFTTFGQFELVGDFKQRITTDNGRKLFSIEFSFQIAYKYPVLNWYLPLYVLVMVSQLTAYMDLERFYETALSVNATIFVAVSSFFTSITGSVPPSAKMTTFELWVTFTFIYPFFMILIQVADINAFYSVK